MSNNKELIERIDSILQARQNKGADYDEEAKCFEASKKALQDAEAEARKQAAIHLHEEGKVLEEINRLKAERVGLVRYCLSIVLDTTVFHEAHLLNNPDKIIEQFKKERY